MKVPLHVIKARRERLAQMIGQHRYLPVGELCRVLGVSEATVRRDLAVLHREKRIKRTYGGALSEFNDRFPSFRARRAYASRGKARIAQAARNFFKPGGTYYFDPGTTIFAVAEAFAAAPVAPVKIVTCNIPVGELLAAIEGIEVYLVAGQLLHLQSVLLGEMACKSLQFWTFDVAFMSAEGMDAEGIWNSQLAIIEQQRAVIERARRTVFCLDESKLNVRAPHFLVDWAGVEILLTDASEKKMREAGIDLPVGRFISIESGKVARIPAEIINPEMGCSEETLPVHVL